MKKTVNAIVIALLLAVTAGTLSACNTMAGVGKDFKSAGDAITGAANENRGY